VPGAGVVALAAAVVLVILALTLHMVAMVVADY
jgi:hypothetical protein